MKKTNKQRKLPAITAILALTLTALALTTLTLTACGNGDPPQPHKGTITAFDRTITVTGDASISTANWNIAKGKLEEAMVDLDGNITEQEEVQAKNKFIVMLDRNGFTMIIETGNDVPTPDANKSMTIGVNYLLDNDAVPTIAGAIVQIVIIDNAFAD